jgi:hypothetical protein
MKMQSQWPMATRFGDMMMIGSAQLGFHIVLKIPNEVTGDWIDPRKGLI